MTLNATATFVVSLILLLAVGDFASTFCYHVPQHILGKLHLRTHHDGRRSYWEHSIISRNPEVLLDGFLGAVPYFVVAGALSMFDRAAAFGALTGLIVGHLHVLWRHTSEIGWVSPPWLVRFARITGLVLPEDHNGHHKNPDVEFGDLFRIYDAPARALLRYARRAKRQRGKRAWPTALGLLLIHLGACTAVIPTIFSWSDVAVATLLYYFTGAIGICLGYHRVLTHRSVRLARPVEYLVATLGVLALQGGPIAWVGTHRAHHAFSDTERDPHDSRRGFWWSHVEWLYRRNPARLSQDDARRLAPDLAADPYYRFLDGNALLLQVVLAIVLFAFGGWSWVVWGVFVRLVATYHVTWLVNSAGHLSGYRAFRVPGHDQSTNNWWVALSAWGEGWHNNHHAFPSSAQHGLRWFELDVTWWAIGILSTFGLAREVKRPNLATLRRRMLTAPRS